MPWTCCETQHDDSTEKCTTCGNIKVSWTLHINETRLMTVGIKPKRNKEPVADSFLQVTVSRADGSPMAGLAYEVELPSSDIVEGTLNDAGQLRIDGLVAGDSCDLEFKAYALQEDGSLAPSDLEDGDRTITLATGVEHPFTLAEWKAQILGLVGERTEDEAIEQIVNQKRQVVFTVGPSDASLAKEGDRVWIRAVITPYDEINAKVQEPRSALVVDYTLVPKTPIEREGKTTLVSFEVEALVEKDGEALYVELDLTACGGDLCTVEVGRQREVAQDVVNFRNWREVTLNLFSIEAEHRQRWPNLPSAEEWLDSAFGRTVSESLKSGFVRLVGGSRTPVSPATLLPDGDSEALQPTSTFVFHTKEGEKGEEDLERLPLAGGERVFLATSDQIKAYLRQQPGDSTSLNILFIDFLADRWKEAPENAKDMEGAVEWKGEFLKSVRATFKDEISLPKRISGCHTFWRDPVTAGKPGLARVSWRVDGFRRAGVEGAPWVAFDDEAEFACCWCPRCEEAVEKGELGPHIKPLTQPGAEYRELQTVEIGDLATMKRWLELEDSRHALLKLPTGTAGDVLPGDQRHVRIEILEPEPQTIEYDLSFEVTYQFRGVKLGTLGFAVGGMIVVRTAGGLATKSAQALALAHEIGHRCGLTYVKHQDGVTGGRTKGIKGLDLPVGLPKTPVYVGHGHTGGHCAYGVWKQHSTEDEREYVFGTEQVPIEFSRAMFPDAEHCLMYGEADESATKVPLLCEWCSPYLRATSLDEVTKKWVDR